MPYAPDLSGCALDDRYELHAMIGEGAFGRVYEGRDRRLARPVAIKVIKPWWAEDPEWAAIFEREAQLLARVSDPGIVQIFDVGHAAEGLYYVSELVDGENLASRLRRGRLAPWEAGAVATQLCHALAHTHAQGIVHRDIKPANILLSAQGRVKVGDFGVARLAEGSTDGGATIVGTPRYMAPEQGRGLPTTPATDVYSVGVVLYEMLAGRPPFHGDAVVELALAHLQQPPPPLSVRLPGSLVAIVERALAKDPGQRYADGAEMAAALVDARRHHSASRHGRSVRGRTRAATPVLAASPAPAVRELVPAGMPALGRPDPGRDRPPARGRPVAGPSGRPPDTRVAPQMAPRRNVNPPARRRAAAALGLVLALLAAMAVGAMALGGPGRTRVPALTGLTRANAVSAALRRHVRAVVGARGYASTPVGTVIAQRPRAGTRVNDGAKVTVTVSGGPAPVEVPLVVGKDMSDARATLRQHGLGVRISQVAAPGIRPGTVTQQSAIAGRGAPAHSTVTLSVAETPRWRPLTTFTGARSAGFRIRGTRWRIVYTMAYQGTCTFIVFCSGPSARVADVNDGSTVQSFGLSDGGSQTRSLSGPGRYEIRVTPGSDDARWSIAVQDHY
jgi:hypothetical protein